MRYPSLRGQEHTAQDFLYEQMARRGLTMDRWAIDVEAIKHHPGFSPVAVDYSNAFNVVGAHRPREAKGKSLILNGHVDVVPLGPLDMWERPPFDPVIEGDWLYGRGSGDMKAGLIANLAALDALKRLGYQPAAPVYVQSVTEEECTGNGALACLLRGYRADAAIIPEPCDDRLTRANMGVIWFRVHVRGIPVHASVAGSGANAIEASYRLIQALHGLEAEWNARRVNHEHFKDLDHPVNLNIGKIEGGDWASSVPAWCSFDCRISFYPGRLRAGRSRRDRGLHRQGGAQGSLPQQHAAEDRIQRLLRRGLHAERGYRGRARAGRRPRTRASAASWKPASPRPMSMAGSSCSMTIARPWSMARSPSIITASTSACCCRRSSA